MRFCSLAVLVLLAAPASAAETASTPSAAAPARIDAPDSPRAAVSEYLGLARRGRYEDAARYLWLASDQEARGPELARKLKAVLERHLWVDVEKLSPVPEGDVSDGLAENTDSIGSIQGQPVLLVRTPGAAAPAWKLAPSTVSRIDRWYGELSDRWIRDHVPDVLLRPGPRQLLWWQWLAMPILLLLAWMAARPLTAVTSGILGRITTRTPQSWDDDLLKRLRAPIAFAWMLAVLVVLLPWLGLYPPAQAFARSVLRAAGLVTFFWALWRAVDSIGHVVGLAPWVVESATARALLALGVRAGKVVVLAVGIVSALSVLGYPVAGLIAGLGVGGLAVALAAQKTVENVFGSISLAIDQPFRVGDFVKVDDVSGTVEAIGLRSTRFRTLDRTMVTIPNGKLADMKVESFAPRDRFRLACTVALAYGTTPDQVRDVVEQAERFLRGHEKVWPEGITVRLKDLATQSLEVEVAAWFETTDWPEFQKIRQDVLLRLVEIVERAGTSFAYPPRPAPLVTTAP
jgi:MscS family membrane protein